MESYQGRNEAFGESEVFLEFQRLLARAAKVSGGPARNWRRGACTIFQGAGTRLSLPSTAPPFRRD